MDNPKLCWCPKCHHVDKAEAFEPITSLHSTAIALADYDAPRGLGDAITPLREREKAVIEAYAEETKAFNDPDTVRLLRVGPQDPAAGYELSFIRRMVKLWLDYKNAVTELVRQGRL